MTDIYFKMENTSFGSGFDSFEQAIKQIHKDIQTEFPLIERLSVVLYDRNMGTLTTFLQSGKEDVLSNYTTSIDHAPSVLQLKKVNQIRIVNDLKLFEKGLHFHTQKITENGFKSGCAVPLVHNGKFAGVTFFNALKPNVFSDIVVNRLKIYVNYINCLISSHFMKKQMLIGAFRGALGMVSFKDPETGNHLERMARYAKLIAQDLSKRNIVHLDDETIEHIFIFAPLHDIGKIGIPDSILIKPGPLDEQEWEVMQTHSQKGKQIVMAIADNLGQSSFHHLNLLANISGSHHETIDGKGYPKHLSKDQIPIETQIVTVADIFDALTSKRPYKPAWTNKEAFQELERLADHKLNRECVNALIGNAETIIQIQRRFSDEN